MEVERGGAQTFFNQVSVSVQSSYQGAYVFMYLSVTILLVYASYDIVYLYV